MTKIEIFIAMLCFRISFPSSGDTRSAHVTILRGKTQKKKHKYGNLQNVHEESRYTNKSTMNLQSPNFFVACAMSIVYGLRSHEVHPTY